MTGQWYPVNGPVRVHRNGAGRQSRLERLPPLAGWGIGRGPVPEMRCIVLMHELGGTASRSPRQEKFLSGLFRVDFPERADERCAADDLRYLRKRQM